MLTELYISNLAVAERLTARFGPGLNALTGETGTGKSLVVGALDLVLGARGAVGLVRRGAAEAEVVARFDLPSEFFHARGVEQDLDEDGFLVLRRVIGADGRSRAYVNDRPAAVGALRRLGAVLADLHGQHEQQNLLREETHLAYLDAFAEAEAAAGMVAKAHAAFLTARGALEQFLESARRSSEALDLARFQLGELEGAELRDGEEEELAAEHRRAAHAGRLMESTGRALELLRENDDSAESSLGRAARLLGGAAELDPDLESLRRQVDDAWVATEEAARELAGYVDAGGLDPERLETLERRLALLAGLRRKYKCDDAGLLAKRDALRREIEDVDEAPRRQEELEHAADAAGESLHTAAAALTRIRSKAASMLSRKVTAELKGLGMAGAVFSIDLRAPRQGVIVGGRTDGVGPRGAEDAAFLLAANRGESGGPLSRIASGGEASRVMLALKNVLRSVDPVPLVIFDEVDSGIGGLVAEAVGKRLRAVADTRQVLVVTHLALIAGRADHHLRLVKHAEGKRTRVEVELLSGANRESELARMLAGSAGGENARRTARAILADGKAG